jgi:hypothetical protein
MSLAEKLATIAENEQKVFDKGKAEGVQSEYDRFWDEFQNNGTRVNYASGFSGVCWNNNVYNPKYPIIVTNIATNMFQNSTMITSTKVPITIDTASAISVFNGATRLATIPYIKVTDKVIFSSWFTSCSALKNITFTEDSVIASSISFQYSPLTVASMKSVISCLKDYAGTGTTHTVTFKADRESMLTDAEKKVAIDKGWTLVWS